VDAKLRSAAVMGSEARPLKRSGCAKHKAARLVIAIARARKSRSRAGADSTADTGNPLD
jgi:hypothetical protein